MEQDKKIVMELLSPLCGEFMPSRYKKGTRAWDDAFGYFHLEGADLVKYKTEIQRLADQTNTEQSREGFWDLMKHSYVSPAVKKKVKSAVISVKEKDGVLYGCATLQLKDFLEPKEKAELYEYIEGCYSDGWGEGFEQQQIKVEDGVIYVEFYQGDDIQFEEVLVRGASESAKVQDKTCRPKLKLTGYDKDIFSLMGDACRLLYANEQLKEADEMIRKVGSYDDYNRVLGIISEYVETELSVPDRSQPSKSGKKKPARESRER